MERGNYSIFTEFILLGLSSDPNLQFPIFYFFLIVYVMTAMGNLLLIVAVRIDSRLHKPMYLFLVNLSFLDICSTSIVPKMLVNSHTGNKTISFAGCFIQAYCFLFFSDTVCFLLTFMAYDRYVAICIPLRYSIIMKPITFMRMISASWLSGAIVLSMDAFVLSFVSRYCGPNIIDHFFCEAPEIIKLFCSVTPLTETLKLFDTILFLLVSLTFILYSYIHIIKSVFRIQSRRHKAFSTCVSHLTAVILFYGSGILIYMKPTHRELFLDKIFSVFLTSVTPMVNPLIYSLRNKEIHRAFKKVGKSIIFLEMEKSTKK